MSVALLNQVRDRMLPMLQVAAENYRSRVPSGYPLVVDTPEQGVIGLEIDPSYAVYITSDGQDLFAEVYRRSPRTDQRSSASRQKEAGVPFHDRRPLDPGVSDQALRNLIAELMTYYNFQPGLMHISDS